VCHSAVYVIFQIYLTGFFFFKRCNQFTQNAFTCDVTPTTAAFKNLKTDSTIKTNSDLQSKNMQDWAGLGFNCLTANRVVQLLLLHSVINN